MPRAVFEKRAAMSRADVEKRAAIPRAELEERAAIPRADVVHHCLSINWQGTVNAMFYRFRPNELGIQF